eukprot:4816211-Pleurochrysis_carterae.AAC.1
MSTRAACARRWIALGGRRRVERFDQLEQSRNGTEGRALELSAATNSTALAQDFHSHRSS